MAGKEQERAKQPRNGGPGQNRGPAKLAKRLPSFYLGLSDRLEAHRRLSKWTWEGWMYVSVTGVSVYFILHVIRW